MLVFGSAMQILKKKKNPMRDTTRQNETEVQKVPAAQGYL